MTYHSNTNNTTQMVVTLIEKAIDPFNPSSNLELFFEITDLINTREENAREAFKTIRKELGVYKGKNWAVCIKLLLLLEVCSNNCDKRFQIHLANKEFLTELKHMIGPKLQPPIEVQEKVLNLIQHWAAIFKNDSDFKPIESLYSELRSKGVDFPIYNPELSVASLSETLKKTTPPRATDVAGAGLGATAALPGHNLQPQQIRSPLRLPDQPPSMSVVKLNEEQIAKLNSELDVVESNVHILNEILNELQLANKPKVDQDDLTLLQDLYKTCKEMQKRITQLIGSISNENIINELLRINDDLNNSFLRYERYERSVNFQKTQDPSPPGAQKVDSNKSPNPSTAPTSQPTAEKSLIDFDEDDFDPIKGAKKTPTDASKSSDNQPSLFGKPKSDKSDSIEDSNFDKQMLAEESEIKEMEDWLKKQGLDENLSPSENSAKKDGSSN